ncbi:hypothetical protein PoB_003848600 [Plakobranchus ocellatus]|uniref:Uncharacterized protein n=1 Tax=Plakobranchus ocellatus TaxID=259542 RepID=A0AAV4ALC5_9GAST|nr:hypothetical protein PoB_003848600 [Plakobranchus ocellatus]
MALNPCPLSAVFAMLNIRRNFFPVSMQRLSVMLAGLLTTRVSWSILSAIISYLQGKHKIKEDISHCLPSVADEEVNRVPTAQKEANSRVFPGLSRTKLVKFQAHTMNFKNFMQKFLVCQE